MKIGKGDAVAYAGLVTAAILETWEPFRKEAAMPPEAHPFLSSHWWNYLPVILLVLVGIVWLFQRLRPQKPDADNKAQRGEGEQKAGEGPPLTHISPPRSFARLNIDRTPEQGPPGRGRITLPLDVPLVAPKATIPQSEPKVWSSPDVEIRHEYIDRIKTNFSLEPPGFYRAANMIQWNVNINPRKSADNITIRLDYTYFTGAGWSNVDSIFVKKLNLVVKSAEKIPIAELDTSRDFRFWKWSFGDKREILCSMHRCCLTFLIGDAEVDRFDFVIYAWKTNDDEGTEVTDLIIIGEDRFTFATDWPKVSV
jgi:hypothetical protein